MVLVHLLPLHSLHNQITDTRAKFTLPLGDELVSPKRRQVELIIECVSQHSPSTRREPPTETLDLILWDCREPVANEHPLSGELALRGQTTIHFVQHDGPRF